MFWFLIIRQRKLLGHTSSLCGWLCQWRFSAPSSKTPSEEKRKRNISTASPVIELFALQHGLRTNDGISFSLPSFRYAVPLLSTTRSFGTENATTDPKPEYIPLLPSLCYEWTTNSFASRRHVRDRPKIIPRTVKHSSHDDAGIRSATATGQQLTIPQLQLVNNINFDMLCLIHSWNCFRQRIHPGFLYKSFNVISQENIWTQNSSHTRTSTVIELRDEFSFFFCQFNWWIDSLW